MRSAVAKGQGFMKGLFRPVASTRGIALLLVLWVLMILMVIVLSFSYMARTESMATLAFRNGVVDKFLAEAGVEKAVAEVLYRNQSKGAALLDGQEVWRLDGTKYRIEADNGYYAVGILDESGKVDINKTPEVILKNLLLNRGVKEEDADTIVDSIQDWRDPDDLHRLHGAESDYYMSLQNPYKAKDADFEAVEELLLVKGMSADILYGDGGLTDILTVNGSTGKINLNAAPLEVLMAIPGMTAELAGALMDNRAAQPPLGVTEVLGGSYAALAKYAESLDTNIFTVESVGRSGGDKSAGHGIRATIRIEANTKIRYLYYKSPVAGLDTAHAGD